MGQRADREERRGGSSPDAPGSELRQPALGMLGDSVGFHLRLAQDASFAHFSNQLGAFELRPGRFALLEIIGQNPNISQQELSEVSGRDKSTTSTVLRDLEKRKLVARRRSTSDRRTTRLSLTAAGREQLSKARSAAEVHEAALDEILGDRKAELLSLLSDLQSGLARRTQK